MNSGRPDAGGGNARRIDFDWLRIGAISLLILTHTTYVYRTEWWRVHSEHAGLWGNLVVEAMAPWRMSLVFFIAGAATRFMLERQDLRSFASNRLMRLMLPFAMAVVVIVPTMAWITNPAVRGDNYLGYLAGPALQAHEILGVKLPDFAHVWFLPYLFAYALAAGVILSRFPRGFTAVGREIERCSVTSLLVVLTLCFILSDAIIAPRIPYNNSLVADPAGHVRGIASFAFGLILARRSQFWTRLQRGWKKLAQMTGAAFVAAMAIEIAKVAAPGVPHLAYLSGLAGAVYGAGMLFLILSVGSRIRVKAGPRLEYLGEAVMPIYLMHQPVIVAVGVAVQGAGLPLWIEYPLMLGAAAGLPLAVYHFGIRRVEVLRVAFGLKGRAGAKRAPAQSPFLASTPAMAAARVASP